MILFSKIQFLRTLSTAPNTLDLGLELPALLRTIGSDPLVIQEELVSELHTLSNTLGVTIERLSQILDLFLKDGKYLHPHEFDL